MSRLDHLLLSATMSILLCLSPVLHSAEFSGKVVGVSDGDTITVLREGNVQEKVRFHGIDCPESGQPFGSKAKAFTSEHAFGLTVRVVAFDKDKYGRTIGDVYLPDGALLNVELVTAGLAWWYRKYAPDDEVLAQLENEARAAKRGLWADSNPVAPWHWRLTSTSTLPSRFPDVDVRDAGGATPLQWALLCGNHSAATMLILRGAAHDPSDPNLAALMPPEPEGEVEKT